MRLLRRRSDRYPPAGPGYVPSSARDWPGVPGAGLEAGDLTELVSEVIQLAPGSRLRSEPCLMCREAIGNAAARLVALTTFWPSRSATGRLTGWMYLIHSEHLPGNFEELHAAAFRAERGDGPPRWPA